MEGGIESEMNGGGEKNRGKIIRCGQIDVG